MCHTAAALASLEVMKATNGFLTLSHSNFETKLRVSAGFHRGVTQSASMAGPPVSMAVREAPLIVLQNWWHFHGSSLRRRGLHLAYYILDFKTPNKR